MLDATVPVDLLSSSGDAPAPAAAAAALQRGSLSFALAARFLGDPARSGVTALYWWCRHCDDVVDGQELGHGRAPVSESLAGGGADGTSVDRLWDATRSAALGHLDDRGVFAGIGWVLRRFQIPLAYPHELLLGMRMDVDGMAPEGLSDLRLYCFRVAGVVGLMYAHIAGVSDAKALEHAVDLGIAMQLTNIARDVGDDARRGRVYLPRLWLREAGVDPEAVLDPARREALALVVGRLLDAAQACYRSGERGLVYLPWRAALAAAAASRIYAQIGRQVRAKGAAAWDERVVVSTGRKLWLLAGAVAAILMSLPRRLKQPWRRVPLSGIWRFT